MERQVQLGKKLTSNCTQHRFSVVWAFKKVWDSLSLFLSGK